jgi:EXLDI family protein
MPTRTIYVSGAASALYTRAQELAGGNLSQAITEALRGYVEIREAQMVGYDEVDVRVGEMGNYQHKRFIGRQIAQWRGAADETGLQEYLVVYETRRGRYVVHLKRFTMPDERFDYAAAAGEADWRGSSNWYNVDQYLNESWNAWGSAELELAVYEDVNALLAAVPEPLGRMVTANLEKPPIEVLDI